MCPIDHANAYRFTGISVEMNDNFFFFLFIYLFIYLFIFTIILYT